jgi:hypothetical protein
VLDHFDWAGFAEHAAGIGRIVGLCADDGRILLDRALLTEEGYTAWWARRRKAP